MKKKELLIILIISVLITYLYIWREAFGMVFNYAGVYYPGFLYPFSFFQRWYPVEIFVRNFLVLAAGWWVLKFVLKRTK